VLVGIIGFSGSGASALPNADPDHISTPGLLLIPDPVGLPWLVVIDCGFFIPTEGLICGDGLAGVGSVITALYATSIGVSLIL
jgi:hypothetical protein